MVKGCRFLIISLPFMYSGQHVKYWMPCGFPLTSNLLMHYHAKQCIICLYWVGCQYMQFESWGVVYMWSCFLTGEAIAHQSNKTYSVKTSNLRWLVTVLISWSTVELEYQVVKCTNFQEIEKRKEQVVLQCFDLGCNLHLRSSHSYTQIIT